MPHVWFVRKCTVNPDFLKPVLDVLHVCVALDDIIDSVSIVA